MKRLTLLQSDSFIRKCIVWFFLLAIIAAGLFIDFSTQKASSHKTPEPSVAEKVDFIAFGDNGSGLPAQWQLAARMAEAYQQHPFTFAIMLGDNIYNTGNVKKLGKSRFTDPYQPLLSKGVRFYAALGNHDQLLGHQDDSIAFFKMPGPYYDFVQGNIHFFVLDTEHFNAMQHRWLANRLQDSHEPWKIVYGHHPVFSSGFHGNTRNLVKNLKPLLESGHVSLYLCGHDHDYERFSPINGVTYIVSGGGGAALRNMGKPVPGSVVWESVHHFLRFEVVGNQIKFEAVDKNGQIFDSGLIPHHVPEPVKSAA